MAGKQPQAGARSVLLMDDHDTVRTIAGRMLIHLGYDVELAIDGEQAIDLYQQRFEAGAPFDVVILDLTIPDGMGGKDALDRLLTVNPQIKALVSSGYSADPVMAHYEDYGFCGVVSKPYRLEDLRDAIEAVFTDTRAPGAV